MPDLFPAFHVVLSARLPAPCTSTQRSQPSSRDVFLSVAVSTQNWGWGKGAYRPFTNLRSEIIQIKNFTEFTASKKNSLHLPILPTQHCVAKASVVPAVPVPPLSHGQVLSCHLTAQVRTMFLSFLSSCCGHVTRLWSLRGVQAPPFHHCCHGCRTGRNVRDLPCVWNI